MLDMFGFPNTTQGDVKIFKGGQTSDNIARQWLKPKNATLLYILAIGGGGGGGGGFSGAAGSTRGGGGGGGSGGVCRLIIPAVLVPDSLFVKVGNGGVGGTGSGSAGTAGTRSFVFTRRGGAAGVSNENVLIVSSNGTANGGGAGTGAAAGSAGASVSASSQTQARGLSFGIFLSQAGIGGSAGGVHTGANGGGQDPLASFYVGGGCGGGGVGTGNTNTVGGSGTGQNESFPTIQGGFIGTREAQAGTTLWLPQYPLCAAGGTGGGSNGTGTGQNGANGGMGSGGGGGGGGVTGGAGGRGGGGIVIIVAI